MFSERTIYEYAIFWEDGKVTFESFDTRHEADNYYEDVLHGKDYKVKIRTIMYNHPNGPEFIVGIIVR